LQPHIQRFLRQTPDAPTALTESLQRVYAIATEQVSGDES
jgi:hypothetical protein